MFGTMLSVPVPDVDRTDHLLILGANPLVSNGSLLTAPDMRGRLRRIRERGGKVVVVDPRRTRTAEEADEHHFIRPGADALLLAAMACTLVEEDLVDPGALSGAPERARARSRELVRELHARGAWPAPCGIEAGEIRRMARELAAAPRAARLRAHRHLHAGVRHAGELAGRRAQRADRQPRPRGRRDVPAAPRPASATRPAPAAAARACASAAGTAACAGCPRPTASCPWRAWPRRSTRRARARCARSSRWRATRWSRRPTRERLERAIEGLDFMLAIDIYVNETTRHADVVLPAPEPLEKSHYDLALYQLAVRNVANYSPPVFERSGPAEWEVLPAAGRRRRRPGAERRRRRARRAGDRHARPARGRRPPARAWPGAIRPS